MSASVEHYEEKATQAVKRADQSSPEGVAFWIGAGQIAATLALVGAVQELTEAVREGRS